MIELAKALLHNLSPLAFVAVAFSLIPQRLGRAEQAPLVGVLFGLGSILAMLDPVELSPGVLVDSRTTMIMLAGFFAGPVAGLVSAAIGVAFRIPLGAWSSSSAPRSASSAITCCAAREGGSASARC